jgi:hypothetical protein
MEILHAATIGIYAEKLLSQPADLLIQGNTSKGIFLRHPANQIIFISAERYRGPFTITLLEEIPIDEEMDMPVVCDLNMIRFGSSLIIDLSKVQIWRSSAVNVDFELKPDFDLACLVGRIAVSHGKSDYPVKWLMQIQTKPETLQVEDEHWDTVFKSVTHADCSVLTASLKKVVGYGRGLTPSGDDFILGMLLGISRYQSMLHLENGIKKDLLNLASWAGQHTTLISINLLDAAANGEADERLIETFDGYVTGMESADHIFTTLQTWGNSSGLDAFCGLVFLLKYVANLRMNMQTL